MRQVPASGYFVGSAVFHYLGPAFAVLLFARVDPLGVAWLRIVSAAIVLAAWRRPWRAIARLDGDTRRLLALMGCVLAAMNACFYTAIDHLPLGTVAAIEFLPVIALAAAGMRTPRNAAALGLAAAGVYAVTDVHLGGAPLGLGLAFANAALFAAYIVAAHRVATSPGVAGIDGLAGAMLIAAVAVTPAAPAAAPALTDPALDRRGHRRGRDVVGHPVRLRPARDGAAPALDIRASGVPPPGHRDGDRGARPRADAHRGRGRRRGARHRRSRPSPRALNAARRATITGAMIGKKTSLAVVLLLGIAAMSAILHLQGGATASKNAQLTLADIRTELNALQSAPFHASAKTGGSRVLARREMDTEMTAIMRELGTLRRDAPPKPLERIGGPLGANYTTLEEIYSSGAWGSGYGAAADRLATDASRSAARVQRLLSAANRAYAARAASAQAKVIDGSIASITVLLGAFAFFFLRSLAAHATAERLARENERLLATSRQEALTDALTGLPNRRALVNDLTVLFAPDRESRAPHLLGLFDLDGFKQFNDTFGHPAGDALLAPARGPAVRRHGRPRDGLPHGRRRVLRPHACR